MKPIDLSICLIVADDPHLPKAIESARASGAEICIAYTGTDEASFDAVVQLADRGTWWGVDHDSEGRLTDFASARTASFALATRGFLSWCDSDDLIVGAEHLGEVIACASGHKRPRLLARYDYAHDEATGEVTTVQWRERIVRRDSGYVWRRPVHEHLVAADGQTEDYRIEQPVYWKHTRQPGTDDRSRNLRILRAQPLDLEDAWLALNLGIELHRANEYAEAATHLERYIRLSGWDDERAMAMVKLSEVHVALDASMRGDSALWWARKALELRPDSFEPNYHIAKLFTMFGALKGDETAIRDAIVYAQRAVASPVTHTPLAVQPLDRSHYVHNLIRTNAEWLEDWKAALGACDAILASRPTDAPTLLARRRYAAAVKLEKLVVPTINEAIDVHARWVPSEPFNAAHAAAVAMAPIFLQASSDGGQTWDTVIKLSEKERSANGEEQKEASAEGRVTEGPPGRTSSAGPASGDATVRDAESVLARGASACGTAGGSVHRPVGAPRSITIFCGDTIEPWNPAIAARQGIGGSETAVIEVSKRLAANGHHVVVYCNCGEAGLYDGVEYTNDLSKVTECDVMIAWRNAAFLEGMPARVKLAWAHDVGIHGATRWTLHLADRVLAVSQWHAEELVRRHGE
jgi:hypothetical protein